MEERLDDMGKRAEQAKKRRRLNQQNGTTIVKNTSHLPSPLSVGDDDDNPGLILSEDLETTITMLKSLCEDPEELAGKGMKELKRAVFDLQRVITEGQTLGSSPYHPQ